jgi:hypothetical protein
MFAEYRGNGTLDQHTGDLPRYTKTAMWAISDGLEGSTSIGGGAGFGTMRGRNDGCQAF